MTPHVATPIPTELAERARSVAESLRTEEDLEPIREEAIRTILELTEVGLQGFFLSPVERLRLGFIGRSAVEVGLKTASGAIAVFIKRLGRSLDQEQGRELGRILDEILIDLVFEEDPKEDEEADEDGAQE